MSLFFVGIGTAHMGVKKRDAVGNVVSDTPAHWDPDPAGGCVAIGKLEPDSLDAEAGVVKLAAEAVDIFGDWDAAAWLGRVLELVHPNRKINVPDIPGIVKRAAADGVDICEYCQRCDCWDCIAKTWKRGENNG